MLMKKLLLSLVMMLTASIAAWAQYVEEGGLRFYLYDSTPKYAEVEAPASGTYSGVINIPSSVSYGGEDYTVKYIGGNAFKESAVTKVTIPSSVTDILNSAFEGCASLTEVNLSEGLEQIGAYAFEHSAVTSLTIPGTVTTIGVYAMEGMASLTKLTFAYGTEELALDGNVFNGTNNVTELVIDRYYTFGNGNGISYNTVKKVTFGEHLTTIPKSVCQGMSLNELNVGANVTAIDRNAFADCTLPEGYNFPFTQIKEIKEGAFYPTQNLPANLDLSGVETIESNAFANCAIQTVKLGSSLTTLGNGAFSYCDQLTAINISGSINSFTAATFQYCTALTNVTFDYSSTALTLEDGTFSYATNLTIDRKISGTTPFSTSAVKKVALGSHMASTSAIQSLNLSQYTGLTEIELLDGWTEVPYQAFKDLTTVTTLTLPEGLETISQEAFNGCTGLTAVTIPGTMKKIDSNAFKGCTNLTSLTLDYSENLTDGNWMFGKGVLLFNGTPFYQTNITDFVADRPFKTGGNSVPFTTLKRATFGSHVTSIEPYMFSGLTLEQLVVSENVTEIGNYAFTNCILPDGVVIPFSNLKKIGNDAFRGCTGLPATIDLSAIEEISSNAFQNCTSIESLTIGGGTIGSSAFSGCTNLASITLNEGVTGIGSSNFSNLANLTTISLPSTLKTIGPDAFANCANLTIPGGLPIGLEVIDTRAFSGCKKLVVTIPSMVKTIGQSAFSGCESLTEVTIPAGITDLGMYTFYGCTGLTSVTIPSTLKTMSRQEFANCSNLTTVTIENGAETLKMASDVFYSTPCTNLIIDRPFEWTSTSNNQYFKNAENVTFGEHVTAIPARALYQSNKLTNITMTDNVTSIGEQAFCVTSFSDTSTKELKLSKNLQTIGKQAFEYMYNGPEALVLPITVTEIGQQALASHYTYPNTLKDIYVPWIDAPLALTNDTESYGTFRYADNQTLWVPGGTLAKYQAADGWKRFQNFDYWSFVVNSSVKGKGALAWSNGETVTDNGTNTAKSVTGTALATEAAAGPVSGLFVREKDVTFTATPARGYELNGFTANGTAKDVTAGNDPSSVVVSSLTADQTIVATFTPIKYNITYNNLLNGVVDPANPATYTVEDNAITLVNPTRTAYNFKGWTGTDLTEATMTVVIPASSIGDREYTATWEPIVYDITYDLAGGAVDPANLDKYTIETADFTLINPTKLGYTFTGWEGTDLTEKTMAVTVTTGHWGERSYTATWEPNPYKVRFDINGGDGTEAMADQDHVYDAPLNLTQNAFTRTGYTFKEWNSKADGTGTVYADKAEVVNLTAVRDEVVMLYAQWMPNPYQVRFNANNGTGTMANQDFVYDTQQALTENAFSRTGYTFKQWTANADGTGATYADKASVKNLTAELNGIVDIYAQWQVIPYTVTYDLAGGTVATANPTEYNVETATFTLTNPTREGYDFAGWEGTGITGTATTVTIAKGSIGDRAYTATWTPIVYDITYDLAGGSVATANPTSYTIETATFTLTNPTKAHWIFKGWTGTGLSAAAQTVTIAKGSIGTRAYTATWEREVYTVSITSNLANAVTASTTSPQYEDDVVLTIADDEDYDLVSLTVDGVDVTSQISGGQYTISSVSANVAVVATYNANKAFITMAHAQQTFSCTQPLDFTGVTGLKAYIASGYIDGTVVLTCVDKVPASTGLFLVGTEGAEYKVPFTASSAFYINLLKPVLTAQTVPSEADGCTNFLYSEVNGVKGFYKSSGSGTVAAGKAYLQLPTSALSNGVKAVGFIFEGYETGIDATEFSGRQLPTAVYDMAGRKVADTFDAKKLPQGVYIVNGKKIAIK